MIQLCKFFLFYLLISIDFHTFSLRNPLKIDPMDNILFWLVPVASVLALCFAYYFHKQMMKEGEGTPQMIKIAAAVRKGAMSYLKQQYKIVGWVFLGLVILFSIMAYGFHVQNAWVPIAFLTGGFFSGLSGFLGMKTATYASARTANAARTSLNAGLRIAFRSGAVMGLVVVGLGLLDISFWYLLLNAVIPADALTPTHKLCVITTTMLTFGMGASTQALFARVGGGIYTKAADVGADLVGKVEAGIPEDDPRNPATIADNVGDNVGDVAGMGADLYESYCGSILATAALGAAAFIHSADTVMQFKAVIAPMLIAAVGIILSIIGIFAVRTKENATMKDLLGSLAFGTNLSSVLIVAATFLILWLLQLDNWIWISCAVVVGLLVGIIIGRSTEYYTSQSYRPTQKLSESGKTGPATVIISGIGLGMLSTAIPVIAVVIGIIASYLLASAGDFANVGMGLYGIGIAAVGMLSTLGITLATDAYGPIADNAGGNAEMSGLGAEVRKRTDALDSLGNTTAATGKGFAIGSAALTGLALLASYIEEIRIGLTRLGNVDLTFADGSSISVANATFIDFMDYYEVHLMNPKVLSGMFLGSMMAFLFCGLTMNAVGRAAGYMVDEVRRQFREIKGILTGEAEPDYERCVAISTKGAQREMVVPSLIAIIAPILTGLIFGVPGVLGLLIGGLSSGFVLAIFMANAGGAWDNAKKYVEEGNFGGKGGEVHKATVVGDTVGDPFKDTSGPSLNILIKLMSMVAIVMAGLTVAWSLF
jgi:K(+)-stimulated pyrophosphate-energized sodium pump